MVFISWWVSKPSWRQCERRGLAHASPPPPPLRERDSDNSGIVTTQRDSDNPPNATRIKRGRGGKELRTVLPCIHMDVNETQSLSWFSFSIWKTQMISVKTQFLQRPSRRRRPRRRDSVLRSRSFHRLRGSDLCGSGGSGGRWKAGGGGDGDGGGGGAGVGGTGAGAPPPASSSVFIQSSVLHCMSWLARKCTYTTIRLARVKDYGERRQFTLF